MGCDIHCVMQKKTNGKWRTIDVNVFAGRSYDLFTFLNGVRGMAGPYDDIAHVGLPDDFLVFDMGGEKYHDWVGEDFWMGDHSWGHLTLEEFCEAGTPEISLADRFTVEKTLAGFCVDFSEVDLDPYEDIKALQSAFITLYGEAFSYTVDNKVEFTGISEYRLVFGYDS